MRLQGKRVVILVDEGFEDLEFWVPRMRLEEEGATVVVASRRPGRYTGKHCLQAEATVAAQDLNPADFDAVVVPGGWAPDKLRRDPGVLDLVRGVYAQGKIVASLCHGGWVLISAGIVAGHKATGSTGIRDDILNAGGTWVDEPAFRDGNLVWGRVVKDIPAFCRQLVAALAED